MVRYNDGFNLLEVIKTIWREEERMYAQASELLQRQFTDKP